MRHRKRQQGFSFIEILIVMGIISVLVGGVIVAINMWTEKGPVFATKNTLTKVKALVENWKQTYEMYPPGDVTRIADVAGAGKKAQAPGNDTNAGIEALYQALHWPGFKGTELTQDEVSNNDDDKLRAAIGKASADLMEIRDAWENPFVYFNRDDYGKYADGASYYNGLGDSVEPKPWKNKDGTFVNPESFQIYSMGPDGEPNTADDITPWPRSDEEEEPEVEED